MKMPNAFQTIVLQNWASACKGYQAALETGDVEKENYYLTLTNEHARALEKAGLALEPALLGKGVSLTFPLRWRFQREENWREIA